MFTNFGGELVFSADLCYNGANRTPPSVAYGASSLPEGAIGRATLGYGVCPMSALLATL